MLRRPLKFLIKLFLSYFLFSHCLLAFPVYRSKIEKSAQRSYPAYYRIPLNDVHSNLNFYVPIDPKPSWTRVLKKPTHHLWGLAKEIHSAYKFQGDYSSDQFLALLANGKKHTFIISSQELIIAEIFPNDKTFYWHSKHVVAAGIAKHVRFAGEMWASKGQLFIDNNSGTYKPEDRFVTVVAKYLAEKLETPVTPVSYQFTF